MSLKEQAANRIMEENSFQIDASEAVIKLMNELLSEAKNRLNITQRRHNTYRELEGDNHPVVTIYQDGVRLLERLIERMEHDLGNAQGQRIRDRNDRNHLRDMLVSYGVASDKLVN